MPRWQWPVTTIIPSGKIAQRWSLGTREPRTSETRRLCASCSTRTQGAASYLEITGRQRNTSRRQPTRALNGPSSLWRVGSKSQIRRKLWHFTLARRDNCHAQARLVRAFHKGDLTERNPTQAYFWSLLAASGDALKESESHQLAGLSESAGGYRANHPCILTRMKLHSLGVPESSLTPDFITLAQDAATNWRRGQQEPSLPAPPLKISSPSRRADSPSSESPRTEPPTGTTRSPAPSPAPQPTPAAPTPTAPPRVAARPPQAQMAPRPQWTPLPGATMLQSASGSRDLATLFATVSRSVWLVFAARSAADLEAGTGVAVGSAVAVSPRALLTKCHVVSGRPLVWIKQGETVVESTVVHGDSETDRCILSAPKATLQPVPGMRRYADLKVGESVYTIGSPRGLERSLGHGIISGLRQPERHLLIQTTAQISPGSSGGGLFDQFGNLLGITTFRLKDSEGLNFAIAVDEYFRP
jgi:S1-C subfamily serine protease